METRRRIFRGLADIPTRSGQTDTLSSTHKIFLKLSYLEMEKARFEKEKSRIAQQIKHLDARILEIEEDQRTLLSNLEGRQNVIVKMMTAPANKSQTAAAKKVPNSRSGTSESKEPSGMKIRY